MSSLDQLFAEYGYLSHDELTQSQIKILQTKLKETDESVITSTTDAQHFLELLRKFREYIADGDKLHGKNYPNLLSSLLSVGEDGLYSNNLRFIFELIQNVDDCEYDNEDDHVLDIHFDFNHNKITLKYNEKGFTPFNVFAITGIAEAAKNVSSGKNEIGEKGIGFKSVFGVAHRVWIRSGWFSFELHKDNFTIPIPHYQDDSYCFGTEMTLYVPNGTARLIYDEIKSKYCTKDALFARNPLLFLNKLTKLRLYYDCFRTMTFQVTRSNTVKTSGFSREDDVRISVSLHNHEGGLAQDVDEQIVCTRYAYPVVFSENACKARYGPQTKVGNNGGKAMTLYAIFPRPEDVDTVGNGGLYSFLPTQLRFNAPIVCHVPFKLDASREFVHPQDNRVWFEEACKYLSELLDYAYQDWCTTVKTDIVAYLPGAGKSLFAANNGKEKCLSLRNGFSGNHFSDMPIFYTVNDHFVNIRSIFTFDTNEQIFAPECAYRLMPFFKELFLYPEGRNISRLGIYTERNLYHRLFSFALREVDNTADILEYLAQAAYRPTEKDIPSDLGTLMPEQITSLILNENFLPKADCEKIFGENINEMNAEWERNRYNDGLRDIVRGHDTDDIYQYLLTQFSMGAFQKYRSQEILLGLKEFIPLKNQLGEIVDTELFICEEVTGYFQSRVVLSMSVHPECRQLAAYLKCASLSTIHYQDIAVEGDLTADDIEDFRTDYFVNGEEILRNYYRNGRLSDELIAEYGLEYIAMQTSQDDDYLEFPDDPVKNYARLRSRIQNELRTPKKIVKVKVERTVHQYMDSSGNMHSLEENPVRKRTLSIYTPEGIHGRCFCQMCRKVKPYGLMEV